jgi:phosphohistidine swiveling domain-containing protein
MSEQTPTPKELPWQVMYEGPDLGHLLAYQVFIQPFVEGSKSIPTVLTGYNYKYYLWYSDSQELGGLHSGYYVKSDLDGALKRGEIIYFDEKWVDDWYRHIDDDSHSVEKIMHKYQLEKQLNDVSKEEVIKLIPRMLDLEYRLVSYVRCSQPQLTDALQNRLYEILRESVKEKEKIESIFNKLTLPEDKSFFTEEEIAWLDIIIESKNKVTNKDIDYITQDFLSENYGEIWRLLQDHFKKYEILPASDRTPAWDTTHFIELLRTNLKTDIDYGDKRRHIVEQYESAVDVKFQIAQKYDLPEEALILGRRIAKVGFYRFKASFYWRWMGYYMVLLCNKNAKDLGITYEEISRATKEELIELLKGNWVVEKEELARRAEAELYLHFEGKDYIWWGREAIEKKDEILTAIDYEQMTELKGEVGNPGKVTGKAFVFHWSDDVSKKVQEMPKGAILVAPQTHPTYMPAIRLAAALACDEGGVTGHAAIVSRELNKPCVIGLHIGTKAIKTGDEIEIDADNGIVRILNKAST